MQNILKKIFIIVSFFTISATSLVASGIRSRVKYPLPIQAQALPTNSYASSDDETYVLELEKPPIQKLLQENALLRANLSEAMRAQSALNKLARRVAQEREPDDRLHKVLSALQEKRNPDAVANYIEAAANIKKRRRCRICCFS